MAHAMRLWEREDPVLRERTNFGAHVSRVARIEPAAIQGYAFVSEPFSV